MSPWTIYWVMQADSIRSVIGGLIAPSVFVFLISAFVSAMSSDESAGVPDAIAKWSRRFFAISLPGTLLLSVAFGLAPTTKTLCAVIAIPAIANSEQLQADASEIYKLGMERLKEELSVEAPEAQ